MNTFYTHPRQLPDVRVAVAMGYFDGVHRGHQAIIAKLASVARDTDACPVALFFSPHPRAVVHPPAPLHITPLEKKAELLLQAGAEKLVCVPFTRELSQLTADEFLEQFFLEGGAEVTAFCVGENWMFGRGNHGDALYLRKWAEQHGIRACIVPPVCHEGSLVSSTRIRESIQRGDMKSAREMLGRNYAIQGIVQHGNSLGGTVLSCPTANLVEPDYETPAFGVYAATARWDAVPEGADAIVYVGDAPTIRTSEQPQVVIELHILEADVNLYDKNITVEFREFLRPSMKFATPEALAKQIQIDISRVKHE